MSTENEELDGAGKRVLRSPELMSRIFRYLSPRDIKTVRVVSK